MHQFAIIKTGHMVNALYSAIPAVRLPNRRGKERDGYLSLEG